MSYSVYTGMTETPPSPVPWDAAGAMSGYYPRFVRMFEAVAVPKWAWRMSYLYNANVTYTDTIYLPPILCGQNTAWKCTDASKIGSSGYTYPYSTSYGSTSVSLTTSHTTISPTYRWFAPYFRPTSCAGWGTTTALCIDIVPQEPSRMSNGYGSGLKYGTVSLSTVDDLAYAVPPSTPTGLSTAHYNAFVREAKRAEWTPVMHSCYYSPRYYSPYADDVYPYVRMPVTYSPDAPTAQRTFSFALFHSGQTNMPPAIGIYFGDKQVVATRAWNVGSFYEYRANLDPLLKGESPDCLSTNGGRPVYLIRIDCPTGKSVYFRSCSVWSGVPAP